MGSLVADGRFRSDLYFRISTIPLVIPPLRERIGDIPVVTEWLLEHLREDLNRGRLQLGSGVMTALQKYNWPGNIRELRNVLERAALLCKDGVICQEDLLFQLTKNDSKPTRLAPHADAEMTLEEMERQHISRVLRNENGKVDTAAAKLGIARSSLYMKIKQYSITTK